MKRCLKGKRGGAKVLKPGRPGLFNRSVLYSPIFACFLLIVPLLTANLTLSGVCQAQTAAPDVFESVPVALDETQIDKLVGSKLKQLHIQPVLCSDSVFVRRAYLDVIGTLPTAQEAREFIQNPDSKNKRRRLIDRLLERTEFADYWAMKWSDVLRIKAEFPVNLWPEAAQEYYQWVHSAIAENKLYDRFARELLTASGSNFRNGPVNFYRAVQNRTPEGIAGAVALTFMGVRLESLPKKTVAGLSAFFCQVGYKPTREWKEEIVFWDPMKCAPRSGLSSSTVSQPAPDSPLPEAIFPDGGRAKLTADKDPRVIFADWLTAPGNSWFRQCIVNRIWYWLLGRGIVQEPDDIRPTNPPSNPALLAYLEKELLAGHYDLKHIYRLILNSQTYQLSSLPRSNTSQAEANFAAYPLRRLDAEVLIDAINKVTGTTDQYTSAIPEPFTYIPKDMPAIALGDGSITSPFLTLFGRSARSTGMADERDNKPVPAQYLHMLNSSHIQLKLMKSPRLREILMSNLRQPQALIEELYLTILSRYPTPYEMRTAWSYGNLSADRQPEVILGARRYARRAEGTAGVKRPRDWMDIAWALVNSTEFLYKH